VRGGEPPSVRSAVDDLEDNVVKIFFFGLSEQFGE
jgi:hypothetical protein